MNVEPEPATLVVAEGTGNLSSTGGAELSPLRQPARVIASASRPASAGAWMRGFIEAPERDAVLVTLVLRTRMLRRSPESPDANGNLPEPFAAA